MVGDNFVHKFVFFVVVILAYFYNIIVALIIVQLFAIVDP